MDLSSVTRRPSSAGSTRSRDSAATSWTTFASIGMAQLRERGQDLLGPRAPEFYRELGAFAAALARHDDPLAELRVAHAHADRACAPPRGHGRMARVVAAFPRDLPRRAPGLLSRPFEAVVRDLVEKTRAPSSRGIPRPAERGVEEVDAEPGTRERHVEESALLLELGRIAHGGDVRAKPL